MSAPPADLAVAARLFGRLLVRELDAPTLAELRMPEVAAALADVGITVPADEQLPELASAFFDTFLHPADGAPPVHSLYRDGNYNGDPAIAMAKIAAAAGRELAAGARGAPPDHLGCILLLWAELSDERPELADLLVEHHLSFAARALRSAAARTDFYGAVARATTSLIDAMRRAAA